MDNYHTPVLVQEVLEGLDVHPGKKYIDATLGGAGHFREIVGLRGVALGIDADGDAIEHSRKELENRHPELKEGKDWKVVQGNFRDVDKIAKENGFDEVNGILYDLGYSTSQLESELGLSFLNDQPLDMRLDNTLGVTAADLVNSLGERELSKLIRELSDERLANKFASAIVKFRSLKKFQTTKELANLLKSVSPPGYENGRIHPATRTFQALRIAVNDELNNLKLSLPRAARLLLPGGLIAVISFHSLEDKLVKQFGLGAQPFKLVALTSKPIEVSESEVLENVHSRSAKLRVYEKTF